jgi:hypothetical protein
MVAEPRTSPVVNRQIPRAAQLELLIPPPDPAGGRTIFVDDIKRRGFVVATRHDFGS